MREHDIMKVSTNIRVPNPKPALQGLGRGNSSLGTSMSRYTSTCVNDNSTRESYYISTVNGGRGSLKRPSRNTSVRTSASTSMLTSVSTSYTTPTSICTILSSPDLVRMLLVVNILDTSTTNIGAHMGTDAAQYPCYTST